jgi:hypothetical protein
MTNDSLWLTYSGAARIELALVLLVTATAVAQAQPANPITLVTIMAAFILFLLVFSAAPDGLWTRLTSGVIAAMAAPMIFEPPFDRDERHLQDPGLRHHAQPFLPPVVHPASPRSLARGGVTKTRT